MGSRTHRSIAPALLLFTLALVAAPAHATVFFLSADMSGLNEVPPNASPATCSLAGTYDDITGLLTWDIEFSGLLAPLVAAHFHGPAAPGVNAPVIVPIPTAPGTGPLQGFAVINDPNGDLRIDPSAAT